MQGVDLAAGSDKAGPCGLPLSCLCSGLKLTNCCAEMQGPELDMYAMRQRRSRAAFAALCLMQQRCLRTAPMPRQQPCQRNENDNDEKMQLSPLSRLQNCASGSQTTAGNRKLSRALQAVSAQLALLAQRSLHSYSGQTAWLMRTKRKIAS